MPKHVVRRKLGREDPGKYHQEQSLILSLFIIQLDPHAFASPCALRASVDKTLGSG